MQQTMCHYYSQNKGLDITKMVGIVTDGASVMTGKTGDVVKLLQGHSPPLIGVHCAAHRAALATSQAAKLVPHMAEYARTIASMPKVFYVRLTSTSSLQLHT